MRKAIDLNPKPLSKGSTGKRKSNAKVKRRMTAGEESSVAKAYKEIKAGRARTFKTVEEYLYLDAV